MAVDTELIKSEALALGFDMVGACDAVPAPHWDFYEGWVKRGMHASMNYLEEHLPLKKSPEALLPGVRSIIAVGLNYYQPNPIQEDKPHIATYALGRDYHRVIRDKLKRLASWMDSNYPGERHRACVDSAPIFERDFARLAGLGWFGKNTCLINSHRGSWFLIGLLLTTVEFEPDLPAVGSCGSCHKCINACPTGAIIFEDDRWQVDSRKCISYLTIEHKGPINEDLQAKIGPLTFGCDICQEVCPFNTQRESQPQRATITSEKDFLNVRTFPRIVELAQLSEEKWDELSSGSPVRRTGLDGIRRNARINLKNSKG